jgi:hypothetical protein
MSGSKDTGTGSDIPIVETISFSSPVEVQYDSAATIDEPFPSPQLTAHQQPPAASRRRRPRTAKRRATKKVTKVKLDVGAQELEEEQEEVVRKKESLRAGLRTRRAPSAKAKEAKVVAAGVKRKASAKSMTAETAKKERSPSPFSAPQPQLQSQPQPPQ